MCLKLENSIEDLVWCRFVEHLNFLKFQQHLFFMKKLKKICYSKKKKKSKIPPISEVEPLTAPKIILPLKTPLFDIEDPDNFPTNPPKDTKKKKKNFNLKLEIILSNELHFAVTINFEELDGNPILWQSSIVEEVSTKPNNPPVFSQILQLTNVLLITIDLRLHVANHFFFFSVKIRNFFFFLHALPTTAPIVILRIPVLGPKKIFSV